jgi:hypothetical protein
LAATSVVSPGLRPLSTSAFLIHSFNACAVQSILPAIDVITAQRDGCLAWWSSTFHTPRSLIRQTASFLNSRPNCLRSIRHLRLHETPNLGVHETGSRPDHYRRLLNNQAA